MAAKTLENLFLEILKDVYHGEKKLLGALPKMAMGAQSRELAATFAQHSDKTESQIERLEEVFALLGKRPEGRTWPVIDVMIDEGPGILAHYQASPALDAGLIASVLTVSHCEITRYATLKRWADSLGMSQAARLLDEALEIEVQASFALNVLAEEALSAEPAASEAPKAAVASVEPLSWVTSEAPATADEATGNTVTFEVVPAVPAPARLPVAA